MASTEARMREIAADIGCAPAWAAYAADTQVGFNRSAHKTAGLRMKLRNNWIIYNSRFPEGESGHRYTLAQHQPWTLQAYLRYKTDTYRVQSLTAFRLGASSLQLLGNGDNVTGVEGRPTTPACHHCSRAWDCPANRHILLRCPHFTPIRVKQVPLIVKEIGKLYKMTNSNRDLVTDPLSAEEIFQALLGCPPPDMQEVRCNKTELLNLAWVAPHTPEPQLQAVRKQHQRVVRKAAWYIHSLEASKDLPAMGMGGADAGAKAQRVARPHRVRTQEPHGDRRAGASLQ